MRRFAVMALVMALATPCVWAGSLADVTMDDQVMVNDTALVLNGMGVRSKLWIKVYVAGLYLADKTTDAGAALASDQPKRVVMHFLTDKATKKKMDAAWTEGFEANNPANFGALEARVATFADLFGDMKDGDRIELTIVPGEGTHVVLNGSEKGTIEGDDFGQGLLRVWLGDSPPTADLKDGLLGK